MSPTSIRALRRMSLGLILFVALVMAYGMYEFPREPYRYVEGKYLDKAGAVHSTQEYEHFRIWGWVFVASWGAAFISGVVQWYVNRRTAPPKA